MFRKNYLLAIFLLLTSTCVLAESVQLNPKLGGNANPVLSPDSLKNMPYPALFLGMDVVPMLVWNDQGGLIAANDAYLKMIGYTRAEMQSGQIDWVTITPPEYRVLDQNCIKQLQTQPYCTPYVKEYVRKDGSHIAVKLWNARDMEQGGHNIAIILPLKVDSDLSR